MKQRTDVEGNVIVELGNGFEVMYQQPKELVTIICFGNPALFERLCEAVQAEYKGLVDCDRQINGFGADLAKFSPKQGAPEGAREGELK